MNNTIKTNKYMFVKVIAMSLSNSETRPNINNSVSNKPSQSI